MKLSATVIDIPTPFLLLSGTDAKQIGIRAGDRVKIHNPVNGKTAVSPVTTSDQILKTGMTVLSEALNTTLNITTGNEVEITAAKRPESIDIIRKKMDGGKFTPQDTACIIHDITDHTLSPLETSAYLTATYIRGLDMDETEYLAREIAASGDTITFNKTPIVDKHSIGGVPGNKITLITVPVIAAAGLLIPKTSSRAITGAGGTADLMEALAPVDFSAAEIKEMTEKTGGVIIWGGATNIAPADDILINCEYPLKINSRGKMLASIMAKKMAVGSTACVIDIPVGPGAKVPTEQEGRTLANDLIELGRRLGISVECAITYGGAPVGRSIGVNLEVAEALKILEGKKAANSLLQKSCAIAGIALEMTGTAEHGTGTDAAMKLVSNGKALQKMKDIIEIQGGDPDIKSSDLTPGEFAYNITSPSEGYVTSVKNRTLIDIARTAGSPADHGAGLYLHKKPGERVKKGETLITIYADKDWKLSGAIEIAEKEKPVLVEGMMLSRISGR